MYTYTCIYLRTYIAYIYYIHTYAYAYIDACTFIHIYLFGNMLMYYIYVHISILIYLYRLYGKKIHVYMYTENTSYIRHSRKKTFVNHKYTSKGKLM